MRIGPAQRIAGQLRLPGDKSISHRAAMIAALAEGSSRLNNFSTSQDCSSTLSCLQSLGVSIEREGSQVRIEGKGTAGLTAPAEALDCGNSGSTMRMLAGVLAGLDFTSTLTGDASLRSRPMRRIIEPLTLMKARVSSPDGRPPLSITGSRSLTPISYELPVASAQVKSCILLAGCQAEGRTEVIERLGATRDHTERMLRWFGADVETRTVDSNGSPVNVVSLSGRPGLMARELNIPGDVSSAAFLIAAAALLPGSDLQIADLGLNPTRSQFLLTMGSLVTRGSLGVEIKVLDQRDEGCEPVGTVRVRTKADRQRNEHRSAGANVVRGALIPLLIDELPLLAVVGTQVAGGIEIRDARELRVKEADRISTTVKNLRAMGAEVAEYEDGLKVEGPVRLRGALMDGFGDHRIAMAFSIAALLAQGPSEITGTDCVAISFPEFFGLLRSVADCA